MELGSLPLPNQANEKQPAGFEVTSSETGKTTRLADSSSCLAISWETSGTSGENSLYSPNWSDNLRAVVKHNSGLLKHEATIDLIDVGRSRSYSTELPLIMPDRWVHNKVSDVKSVSSLFEGAIKFTIRAARSSYDASDAFFVDQHTKKDFRDTGPGAKRFLGLPQVEGTAHMQRVDVKIFELGDVRSTVFAHESEVDWGFEALHLKKEDPFTNENTRTRAFGGNITVGPLGIVLTRSAIDTLVGAPGPTRLKQEALTSLDVADLHRRLGSPLAGPLWTIAPASIWASVSRGSTDGRQAELGPPDVSSAYTLGASWAWDTWSAEVSYWRHSTDVRRAGLQDYDWAGQGLSGYLTSFGPSWNAAYSFFYQDSTNFRPHSRDVESNYHHSLNWTFKPRDELGFSAAVGLGYFAGDYGGYDYNSTYWSTTAGIDFTEFIRPREEESRAPWGGDRNATALKAHYTLRDWRGNEDSPVARPPGLEHFIGVVFTTEFW
jgi:hypothetical protein